MTKTIGILVGAKNELDFLLSFFKNKKSKFHATHIIYECRVADTNVVIMQTGIGKVNAALGTTIILGHYHIDLLINTGSAGSLSSMVKPGDLVIADQVLAHDYHANEFHTVFSDLTEPPSEYYANETISHYLGVLKSKMENAQKHIGLVISGDKFIVDIEERFDLMDRFPDAIAVDMESSAIGHVCFYYGVPFVAIRGINNNSNQNALSDYEKYFTQAGRHACELVLTIIKYKEILLP